MAREIVVKNQLNIFTTLSLLDDFFRFDLVGQKISLFAPIKRKEETIKVNH